MHIVDFSKHTHRVSTSVQTTFMCAFPLCTALCNERVHCEIINKSESRLSSRLLPIKICHIIISAHETVKVTSVNHRSVVRKCVPRFVDVSRCCFSAVFLHVCSRRCEGTAISFHSEQFCSENKYRSR